MRSFLVSCDGLPTTKRDKASFDQHLEVRLYGSSANGRFELTNVTNSIARSLQPLHRDLLELAAYVYLADTEATRGTEKDLVGRNWRRDFTLLVPVLRPTFWSRPAVSAQLSRTLAEASGDRWEFRFKQARKRPEQLFHDMSNAPFPGADSVCLFSGGADSLTGVTYVADELKRQPLLVSHRSSTRIDSRQETLLTALNHGRTKSLSQISLWLNRIGTQAKEPSQRTRGFLFLSLASALALELNLDTVFVPENGPVSINVRKLQQSYGTTLSRTTHPVLLKEFRSLLLLIGKSKAPEIVNPFIFETKAEVLRRLSNYGYGSLLQETVSCAHIQGMTRAQPHCGVCSQCIDRRFATVVAGLEHLDQVARYEKDVFTSALEEGSPRMQAESHLRLGLRLRDLDGYGIVEELGELATAASAIPGGAATNAKRLEDMMRRYGAEIEAAVHQKTNQHFSALVRAQLPDSCLLRLAASASHLRNLPAKTADAVGSVLKKGWPKAFASVPPKDEHHIQDITDALLDNNLSKWTREGPLLPYSIVRTKPDFSSTGQFFIEIKFVRDKSRLNRIVTEITSRITIYTDQGASVLFAILDPSRAIADDDLFSTDLRRHSGVFVEIIR